MTSSGSMAVPGSGRQLALLAAVWCGCGLLAVVLMASPLGVDHVATALHVVPGVVWLAASLLVARRWPLTPSLLLAGQLGLLTLFFLAPGRAGAALVESSVVAVGEEVLLRILPMWVLAATALSLRVVVLSGTAVVFFLAHATRDSIFAFDLIFATVCLTLLAVIRVPPLLLVGLHLLSNVLWHAWVWLGGRNGIYLVVDTAMFATVTAAVLIRHRRLAQPEHQRVKTMSVRG